MISASVISLKRLRLWALSGKAGNSIAGSPNSNGGTVHFGGLVSEVYHIREPQKIPLVMSPGRDTVPNCRRRQPQGPHVAQSRLWLRPARQRNGQAKGQAYRQRAKDHPARAVQGPQEPALAKAGDRNVMLSPKTLDLLRQWWKARPSRYDSRAPILERWLFPG